MSEHLIQDSNGNQLRFQGELAAEAGKELNLDDGQARKFLARIYAVEGGGFVSSLQYETSSPGEKPIAVFEEIDFADDVEKFYYVFEPSEIFCNSSELPREVVEQRPVLSKQLAKHYETLVFSLLDDFRAQVLKSGLLNKPNDSSAAKKPSFWNSLGMS